MRYMNPPLEPTGLSIFLAGESAFSFDCMISRILKRSATPTPQPQQRGRILLAVIFWVLVTTASINIRVLLDRYDLVHVWTQLGLLGSTILLFSILWAGQAWARRLGALLFLIWAVVYVRPVIFTGPYVAAYVHFGLTAFLLVSAFVLSFSKSVASYIVSRKQRH